MKLFAPTADGEKEEAGRLPVLPNVRDADAPIAPPLPLALYDLDIGGRGRWQDTRGPAPLALRLFVEAVLSTPSVHRDTPFALSVGLRRLLAWAYPSDSDRPMNYWSELDRAAVVLDSPGTRLPWYDSQPRRPRACRVVSVSDVPRGPEMLDDCFTLTVYLPTGTGMGPSPDRERLHWWGGPQWDRLHRDARTHVRMAPPWCHSIPNPQGRRRPLAPLGRP